LVWTERRHLLSQRPSGGRLDAQWLDVGPQQLSRNRTARLLTKPGRAHRRGFDQVRSRSRMTLSWCSTFDLAVRRWARRWRAGRAVATTVASTTLRAWCSRSGSSEAGPVDAIGGAVDGLVADAPAVGRVNEVDRFTPLVGRGRERRSPGPA